MANKLFKSAAICLALIGLSRWCSASDDTASALVTDTSKAWLLHLPGISGETGLDRGMIRGLRQGGYTGLAEIYDWTGENPGLAALRDSTRNHKQAEIIASMITQHFRDQPEGQILLVSHSAGTGLGVWALEDLADDVKVDTVLLLSPALSPDYNLSKALSHVKGKMYAFTSPNDLFVLAAGTKLFGTVDGKKSPAAGNAGFTKPKDADDRQYAKLVAEPYQPAWMKFGNIGDHVGMMIPDFDAAVVCPLLKAAGHADKVTDKPANRPSAATQPSK